MKTAAFVTLGCKLNHYETEAIREEVLALGYEEVSSGEGEDPELEWGVDDGGGEPES